MESRKIPTYDELVDLRNHQIVANMKQLSTQFDEARLQGKNTSELALAYRAYEEEWLKRLALSWYAHK